jgi:O-methyltransferase
VSAAASLTQAAKAFVRRVLPASVYAEMRGIRAEIRNRRGLAPPLVPVEEVTRVYRRAIHHLRETGSPVGDYLEFGVFQGDSLLCMDRVRREAGLTFRMFGFDSFEGLPKLEPGDEALGWEPGAFRSSYGGTRRRLTNAGIDWSHTVLVKGWFDETLTPELPQALGIAKASTIMIDSDLYSSAKQALEFSAPLIQDEAIVFFDDWHGGSNLAERNEGEARAFCEFLAAHPELEATEFDSYVHTEWEELPIAKVFRLTRLEASAPG